MRAAGFLLLAAIVAGVAILAWKAYEEPRIRACHACLRQIPPETRTVVELEGRKELVCCPACWLTLRRGGAQVELVQLTDYQTQHSLAPEKAFFVVGSDVNLCRARPLEINPDKQPMIEHSDRCAPSILAFANEQAARQFVSQHGGQLMRLKELSRRGLETAVSQQSKP